MIDGGSREVGWHQASWNGHDDRGRDVTSGTYVLRLTTAAGERRVVKLTLMK